MIDVMKLRGKERLEESDRWISDIHTQQSSKTLKAASHNSVKWPHLVANGRKGGEF
jgi:hypothetical protein